MKQTPATTKDHQEFCLIEGWQAKHTARGKTGDHFRYILPLPDGRCLYTRISHPVNRSKTYGKSLWSHILKDQLEVSGAEFWDCVDQRIVPNRGMPTVDEGTHLPVWLVVQLKQRGAQEHEISGLSVVEATQLLANLYRDHPGS